MKPIRPRRTRLRAASLSLEQSRPSITIGRRSAAPAGPRRAAGWTCRTGRADQADDLAGAARPGRRPAAPAATRSPDGIVALHPAQAEDRLTQSAAPRPGRAAPPGSAGGRVARKDAPSEKAATKADLPPVDLGRDVGEEIDLGVEHLGAGRPLDDGLDAAGCWCRRAARAPARRSCRAPRSSTPARKKMRRIAPCPAPSVRRTAMSRPLFFTSMIRHEMMFAAAISTSSIMIRRHGRALDLERVEIGLLLVAPVGDDAFGADRLLHQRPDLARAGRGRRP